MQNVFDHTFSNAKNLTLQEQNERNQLTKVEQKYNSSEHSHNMEATQLINNITTNDWTDDKANV